MHSIIFNRASSLTPLRGDLDYLILIDLSWLLHKSFHSYLDLSVTMAMGLKIPTGDIHGVLQGVKMWASKYPNSAIVLCMDSPSPKRKQQSTAYKSGRHSDSSVYAKIEEAVITASLLPNLYVAYHDDWEADDQMFDLAAKLHDKVKKVFIFASDKDLYQALQFPNVVEVRDGNMVELDRSTVLSEFNGVPPERLALYRSLVGDTSDNLKAYPRFPRALAAKIAKTFTNPNDAIENASGILHGTELKWWKKVEEDPMPFVNNFSMMLLSPLEEIYLFKVQPSWDYIVTFKLRSWALFLKLSVGIQPPPEVESMLNVGQP